jgi:hypothetical protein
MRCCRGVLQPFPLQRCCRGVADVRNHLMSKRVSCNSAVATLLLHCNLPPLGGGAATLTIKEKA